MSSAKAAIQLISTGGLYGAERVMLELASFLHNQGWESHVIAIEGDGAHAVKVQAEELGLRARTFVERGRLPLRLMVRNLAYLLRDFPRAIVHSHGYKPDIILASMRVPRALPCIATCHNWISETRKMKLLERVDRCALRSFDHVVAVSNGVGRQLLAAGVRPERFSKIDNGIAAASAQPGARDAVRAELAIPSDSLLVTQVGRLVNSKRNDLLIRAVSTLSHLDKVHVLLLGEGPNRAQLETLAAARGLARRVHFLGYRSDVSRVLSASDVLALTSDVEAMPLVILEAMATHCPIVSSRVGDVPNMVVDGRDAWLVPPNDIAALTGALQQALTERSTARERAASAHRTFLQRYSAQAMGTAYVKLYEQLWSRRWP